MPVFRLKPGGREPAPGIFLEAEKFFVPPVCSKLLGVFLMYLWTIEQFTHDIKHTWS